jgi:prepilin-type N-terminal cleavage/methylation domain-containing protein
MVKKMVRKQKGFTLLEIIIAMALFAIVIPAIIGFTRTALSNNTNLGNQTLAVNQVKNAFNFISQDAQMAGVVTPTNGNDNHFPLTLSWINYPSDEISVVYSIINGNLQRDYTDSENPSQNNSTIVATNVNSDAGKTNCDWPPSDTPAVSTNILTVNITITVGTSNAVRQFQITPRVIQSEHSQTATTLICVSSPSSTNYGDIVNLTATVSPIVATGDVTFLDGGNSIGTSHIGATGQATYAINSLAADTHHIKAVYSGDVNYTQSTSAECTQTVAKVTPTINLTSSINPSAPGTLVTFKAILTPNLATGTVTFWNGATQIGSTVTLSNGVASYDDTTGSDLVLGPNSIKAIYSGDANDFGVTSSILTQVVSSGTFTIAVTSSSFPSTYGGSVTFTATVIPNTVTGTVTFMDGGTSLGTGTISGGVATYTTTTLTGGIHVIKAVLGTYTSPGWTQTVNKVNSTTALTGYPNPSTYGGSVIFTAIVIPGATGTVTFKDGATVLSTVTLSDAVASYTNSTLLGGSHSITAVYSGDSNYNGSTSSTWNQTVNKAASTVAIGSSVDPSTYGGSVTFNALVSGPGVKPTGSVQFTIDGGNFGTPVSLDVNGGATSNATTTLTVGSHVVMALYSGDSNYIGNSAALSGNQIVNKATPTVNVSSNNNPSTYGGSVKFTAVVAGSTTPTGTVQFTIDGVNFGAPISLSGGSATSSATTTLTGGTHAITAIYSGDANYNTNTSSTLTQTVNKANSSTALAPSPVSPSTFGVNVTFTATMNPLTATGTVTFQDGGITIGTGTLSSGVTTFATSTLTVGAHTITAVYGGDTNYNGSTSSVLNYTVNGAQISIAANTYWSSITTGSGPGGQPSINDTVTIRGGATLTVDLTGCVAKTINVNTGDAGSTGTLAFLPGQDVTVGTTVAIGGNSTKKGTIDMSGGGTLTLTGSGNPVTLGTAGNYTFTGGTGLVVYGAGVAQTIEASITYHDLTTGGGNTKTPDAALTATGNLTIGAGTTLDVSASNYAVNVGGNWTNNGTSFMQRSGTVTLNGAAQTVSGTTTTTFNILALSGTSNTTLGAPIIVSSNLTIGAGTTLSPGANALTVNGNWTNSGTFTAGTCTVTLGGAAQTITGATTFYYLTTGGSNTKTLSAAIIVNKDLTIGSGTTLSPGANPMTVTGNWTNNGTFTAGTGTVTFNGTAQTIGGSASTTFNNLSTIGSTNTSTGIATTVGGALNIGDGTTFTVGAFTLTVTGTTTVGSGGSGGALVFSSATNPAKSFTGLVTINTNSSWTESAAITPTFRGGITLNGTGAFTASTGVHTFGNNPQALTGTFSIPSVSAGIVLTNNNTLTVATALSGTGGLTNGATHILNINGTCSITTLTNAGTVTITGSGLITTPLATFTNTGTLNLTGSGTITGITNNAGGIVNLSSSGTITSFNNATATSTLNISATTVPTITTLTTSTAGNTVNYTGTGQTIKVNAYSNLILSGGAETSFAVTTVNSNLTLSGSATATTAANLTVSGNLSIGDGTTFTVAGFTLTVTGTTTVGQGTSGTLAISNATGTKTFTGAVMINTGGVITESAAAQLSFGSDVTINGTLTENGAAVVGIAGNLNNNGVYTASTGVHTFSGAAKAIGGTNAISIPSATFNGTYNNNNTLTVSTSLAGTGGLTNAVTRTLSIGGTCSITTLTNTGTVTITGSGAISTALASFTNTGTLNLNGSGTITGITNNAGGIVNLSSSGNITSFNNATATSTLNISAVPVPTITTLTTGTAGNTVNYSGAGAQTVKVVTYSNLILSGSGVKTIGTAASGTLTSSNLSLAPAGSSATASVTNTNITVYSLSITGASKAVGTWGYGPGTPPTNKDTTHFASTTGYLNVTH